MANLDQPVGAKPYGDVLRIKEYTAGGAVYPGDFVHLEDDGKVDAAAASENLIGVAMSYASADGSKVLVADDPNQRFIVQADETEVDAQTDVGLNYNIVAGSPNTTYKISRQEMDSSSGATTSTLPLKLLGIDPRKDNAFGEFVDCIVIINNHVLGNATEGL
jgi:hypothetical protein